MKYGFTKWSIVPMRAKANERSEMVNQLLFGDLFKVIKEKDEWLKIELDRDQYVGWINRLLFFEISEEQFFNYKESPRIVLSSAHNIIQSNSKKQFILPGSTLYNLNKQGFLVGEELFEIESYQMVSEKKSREEIAKTALLYLNTPYLWGGKSLYGIDCSGFTQLIYGINGIDIPRDAYQQAAEGQGLSFLSEAKVGDLAFFDNEEGKIIHVGMILEGNTIIHSSGQVRIDLLDHQGIFNADLQTYTHNLRVVQNIIQD